MIYLVGEVVEPIYLYLKEPIEGMSEREFIYSCFYSPN